MKTVLTSLTALLVFSSGVALAADAQRQPPRRTTCKADVEKLCAGIQPGGGRIAECLKQNQAQVSAPCQDAIAKARKRKAPSAPPQG